MKHWVLFTLFMLPLFFQVLTVADGILTLITNEGPEQDEMLLSSMVFLGLTLITALISMVLLECWLYALATRLYAKLPQDHRLKIGRFRFAFFFPIFYIVAVMWFMWVAVRSESPFMLFMIFPFHIFAMACMFYVLRFVAKSLKSVELQRPVRFGDYAGEFFLIWFFLIGVWIIQPRVNKIFAGEERSEYGGPVDRYLK